MDDTRTDPNREDLHWHRSLRCGNSSCVEVAHDGAFVHMRDSKDPDGPILSFTIQQWKDILVDLQSGALSPTPNEPAA
jgi:hypothetical protein